MGLNVIDKVLRESGFGQVVRKSSPLAPRFDRLHTGCSRAARYVNPRFRFCFIEDGSVNGIAYSGLWHSYAGLTCGAVLLLEELWILLLASEHVMPQLAGGKDNGQLRADLQTAFDLCVSGNHPSHVPDGYFARPKGSNDPIRTELAYRLFRSSLLFLYYHELAHLCRGHTRLCQAAGCSPMILEARGRSVQQASPAPRQWAELEADWLATIWLLQNSLWSKEMSQNIDTLFELFLGIGLIFLIFSMNDKERDTLKSDHPTPNLRLAHLLEESTTFLIAGERYPFTNPSQIQAATERSLAELSIIGTLGNFDWYSTAVQEAPEVSQQILDIRMKAGRTWVEAANNKMRRLVKRPPPKIMSSI